VGRDVGSMDCIGPFVVSLYLGKFIKVVSDSPPKAIGFVLTGVEGLEVSKIFSKNEIDQGEIAESEIVVSDEFFEMVEFGSSLL